MRRSLWGIITIVTLAMTFSNLGTYARIAFSEATIQENIADRGIFFTPNGENVIYIKKNSDDSKSVFKYNIKTKEKTQLSRPNTTPYFESSAYYWASDEYACWFDKGNYTRNAPRDIIAANLATGELIQVTSSMSYKHNVSVSGHYVVWAERGNDNGGVYYRDLSKNENSTKIQPILRSNKNDTLSNIIAFTVDGVTYFAFNDFNENSNIMLFDTSSKSIQVIANSSNLEMIHTVCGKYVVFCEYNQADPPPSILYTTIFSGGILKYYDVTTRQTAEISKIETNEVFLMPNNREESKYLLLLKFSKTINQRSIKLYDFNDKAFKDIPIEVQPEDNLQMGTASMSNNKIIFLKEGSNTDKQLYLYDLEKKTISNLEYVSKEILNARISLNNIIYCSLIKDNDIARINLCILDLVGN